MRSASRLRKHRERLACAACRKRKLNCDRESPCSSCVRRRDATSCSYEVSIDDPNSDRLRDTQAQARLEHLEHLVGLLAEQPSATTIGVQNDTPAAELPLDMDTGEHTIASSSSRSDQAVSGTTHWSAMLDDIQALRSTLNPLEGNDIDEGDTSAPQADVGMGMDVMFGAGLSQAISIEQVLSTYLPSRRSTDRLVSAYFRVRLYITPYIHSVQFQRQYEAFWSDPGAASPLWISILFSMLFISANISRTGKENEIPGHGFAVAAAQCLALGEYFRPKAFCFEALLLYLHSRFITCLEIHPDMGALLSVLAHIATVSGYHRESSVLSLSPFAAEMRRRAWTYEECKPGGQLETEEWFMKSITWHDFLLGVTTLCLVAYAANQITEGFHIDQLGVQLLWSKGSIQSFINSGSYDLSFKGTTKQRRHATNSQHADVTTRQHYTSIAKWN
ncbi:transcriptional regulatory [Fusarium subglutinans]|uniref:Transcriptional regulatory n=1 Tax=Gibberella subglutinans TaxID=42677 RepID=A0A8H5LDM6_GIBSU|nr:transcriptional regulatory [Fusarium subglutinans]KAF5590007.1 transcriptional regulatory [Fusarium subglutinans]